MRFAGLPPHAGLVVGALLLASCGEPSAASTRALSASRAEPRPIPTGEALAARLGCGSCHPGVGAGEPAGGLPVADPALDPAAVFAYLMDPPAPA